MSEQATFTFEELAPEDIVLQGPYERLPFDEEAEAFQTFLKGIEAQGDIGQPIGVRTDERGEARILIYGMRRWRAALRLGFPTIPARNYGPLSEPDALRLQIAENANRRDASPVERAHSLYLATRHGRSVRDVAKATGLSPGYVSQLSRVGEAVAQLSEDEQRRLATHPNLRPSELVGLAPLDPPQRVQGLRELLNVPEKATSGAKRTGAKRKRSSPAAPSPATPPSPSSPPPWDQGFRSQRVEDPTHGKGTLFEIVIGEEEAHSSPEELAERLAGHLDRITRFAMDQLRERAGDRPDLKTAESRLEEARARVQQALRQS